MSGLKELDVALGEMSKGAARGALRRALTKAAEPMRAAAERNAPEDTGALKRSIALSSKIDNRAGKAEYAAVMKGGGSKAQAAAALRDARRAKGIGESFAEVFMGPKKSGKRKAIKAMVQEFGSKKQAAQPYMRPAFDAEAQNVINGIKSELSTEIDKSVRRARARAAKKAGK
ncbi:HK97-gp10 family putative phage morphogenesis protein [Aquamicrobium ahrensii]|uniref:HK97 gp10 family phage protein n=1 Tax=Aquamicrobium ahrensii TaxID=469551 RepID=A0ABV2KN73_9HYPH